MLIISNLIITPCEPYFILYMTEKVVKSMKSIDTSLTLGMTEESPKKKRGRPKMTEASRLAKEAANG